MHSVGLGVQFPHKQDAALAEVLARRVAAAGTAAEAVATLLGQLARWQKFLAASVEGLSDEAQRGLWGELHCLRERLLPVLGAASVAGWKGGERAQQEQIAGCDLRYVFLDIKKLSRLRVGEREAIELNFVKTYGGAVPALETKTDEYRTFLLYLPAPILSRIYGEHGQRLLERNVRAFLQAKVRRKISSSLRSVRRRKERRW